MEERTGNIPWDFYAKIILISYSFLQIMHWQLLPLYMDIYYHLHTAWGFLRAGGYSGWDFWEYAPYGRPHMYPPVIHLIIAFFMKLGISSVFLAKLFEAALPPMFLAVLWHFIRGNYGPRQAVMTLITIGSSFSFYLSLINHLPAALALIFGILSLCQLFRKKPGLCAFMLVLCFYTHAWVPWFFVSGIFIFSFFEREYRKQGMLILLSALVFSLPMIIKQLMGLSYIKAADLNEKYFCEFKVIDYIPALAGIAIARQLKGKYRLFPSLFLSGFIFIAKPFRFFSAEGYLPVALLAAVSLNEAYGRLNKRKKAYAGYLLAAAIIFFVLVSPTLLMEKKNGSSGVTFKAYNFDSAIMGLMFPDRNKRSASQTLWLPNEYLPGAELIRRNSGPDDIIYSRLISVSVCLAALSGRASANGLLPDVPSPDQFDPISVSKIFIAEKGDAPERLNGAINKYNLIKIGESKLFVFYKNPSCYAKAGIKKPLVPFTAIIAVISICGLIFLRCSNRSVNRGEMHNFSDSRR